MTPDALPARWNALIRRCGTDETRAAPHYQALARAYAEPHRAYHTLPHIAHFLGELDAAGVDDPAADWAAWYHDAVYRPGAGDNEARSAGLARAVMTELGLDTALIDTVTRLILATKTHDTDPAHPLDALFLDADLAILGAEPAAYAEYANAVRREFRHLPDLIYRPGRRKFLKGMLERERVFQTAVFGERYEARARGNIAWELSGGKASPST